VLITAFCFFHVFSPQLKDRKKPIFVSEKKGCHLCHNTFSEPDVVCLPGGVPVHTHCVAQRVRDSPTKRQLTNSSSHTWDLTRQIATWSVIGGIKREQDVLRTVGITKKHRTPIAIESAMELVRNTKKAVCMCCESVREKWLISSIYSCIYTTLSNCKFSIEVRPRSELALACKMMAWSAASLMQVIICL